MNRRLWWAWLFGACLVGCGGGDLPVVHDDPPVTPPAPVDPGPPAPAATGNITEDQFAAVDAETTGTDGVVRVGTKEADMLARLGPPFAKKDAAGFAIYSYVLPTRTAFFWVKGGKVQHKGTDR